MELIKCILYNQKEKALILINSTKNSSDLNFKDENGYTALIWASFYNKIEIVKALISKCNETSINIQNKEGYTALMYACLRGHTEVVNSLLTKCGEASINIQDLEGHTALMLASEYGQTEIVEALLTKCSEKSINIQDNYVNTALMLASYRGRTEIVKALIYLSDIYIKNGQNETVFDIVYKKEITDLFDFNTGCDTSLKKGKSISNITLASLHSLKSDKWLNLF